MQQQIYYELSILAKCVHFKNLSGASAHVGLSQPQLSRIIAKIEDELKIVLLDRSAKRKSGWTPVAFQLAQLFEKSVKRLEIDLQKISHNEIVAEMHIGTLEGLSNIAIKTCAYFFEKVGVKKIFIESFDLSELEAHFMSGHLDLIFTSRLPGRQKHKHAVELGFQNLEKVSTSTQYLVYSSFEHSRLHKKENESENCVLVSNSLAIRKEWLKEHGGTGFLPSKLKVGKSTKDSEPVILVGSDVINPALWEQLETEIAGII